MDIKDDGDIFYPTGKVLKVEENQTDRYFNTKDGLVYERRDSGWEPFLGATIYVVSSYEGIILSTLDINLALSVFNETDPEVNCEPQYLQTWVNNVQVGSVSK